MVSPPGVTSQLSVFISSLPPAGLRRASGGTPAGLRRAAVAVPAHALHQSQALIKVPAIKYSSRARHPENSTKRNQTQAARPAGQALPRGVDPMLGECWPSVADGGPTLTQH